MKKYELESNDINIYNSLIDDKLENTEYLSSLIRLISNIDDNEVICVDGDWGVGKTFLLKQLMYLIMHYKENNNQEQFKVVEAEKDILLNICDNNMIFYYNAWENDDHSDVLESIIYNILNCYPKYKNEVTSKFDKEETVKEVLNILTKIVSSKFFNIDAGIASHNSRLMVERRRENREKMEQKKRMEIDRKKAEIQRLQSEIDDMYR